MYVNFAGDRLSITDPISGESTPVDVFVAILPCHYTFCKAVASQRKEDFIGACEDALRFYGGAPMAIVPDNLKSAVNRPDKVEPIINQDFAAFAEHYGCVVKTSFFPFLANLRCKDTHKYPNHTSFPVCFYQSGNVFTPNNHKLPRQGLASRQENK